MPLDFQKGFVVDGDPVFLVDVGWNDNVEKTEFVFESDEAHAFGSRGPLSDRDEAGDAHFAFVGNFFEGLGGDVGNVALLNEGLIF